MQNKTRGFWTLEGLVGAPSLMLYRMQGYSCVVLPLVFPISTVLRNYTSSSLGKSSLLQVLLPSENLSWET